MKRLVILGSTGSIGRQTLDVVRGFPDEFDVVGLSAGRNAALLQDQIHEFRPRYFHCCGEATLDGATPLDPREMATLPEVDLVVVATVGGVGMRPTFDALNAGKPVALANKEVLVMAGGLVTAAARNADVRILPVDSEPSAIWQCIEGDPRGIARLYITASGGAFRDRSWDSLRSVTPEEALDHPTWKMGAKITIDSATLVNKAFEVIEAHWLFGAPFDRIEAVVHRQSIIHSMVEFSDGSVKAQLGPPDMRYPIQYALMYPHCR
ncbi:MAG: 1-deoxy-D-xylulose-5-phosphate reductoisomerase, partial [Gemmatimonadetes bacterium]|nr:1-deoxy-D-xylulose-5-phosphate reductoisomerase [Gemmatimonadota bacterium]